jgi:hypothetical protein
MTGNSRAPLGAQTAQSRWRASEAKFHEQLTDYFDAPVEGYLHLPRYRSATQGSADGSDSDRRSENFTDCALPSSRYPADYVQYKPYDDRENHYRPGKQEACAVGANIFWTTPALPPR